MITANINTITGKGVAITGDDIDTDRITPARFLKELTFDNFGSYVFFDEREQLKQEGKLHPLDDPKFKNAKFLIVNSNFGCGSSREHAAQAIKRWGIDCIIGESFSEIFYNNCISVGMPCLRVTKDVSTQIQAQVIVNSEINFSLDLQENLLLVAGQKVTYVIPEGVRKSYLEGTWDATSMLLQNKKKVIETDMSLPY